MYEKSTLGHHLLQMSKVETDQDWKKNFFGIKICVFIRFQMKALLEMFETLTTVFLIMHSIEVHIH
jgi:hypothetical protein